MGLPEWLTIPVADPGVDAVTMERQRLGRLCIIADPGLAQCLCRASSALCAPESGTPLDHGEFVDCVDPGSLSPLALHVDNTLDRHRLDVSLSRGRHAAERAKLAGCHALICWGVGADDGFDAGRPRDAARRFGRTGSLPPERHRSARHDATLSSQAAYARLRCLARFEIAALTGALIAGAQMGLRLHPSGFHARVAARIALELNPGVTHWLVFARPERFAPDQGTISVRDPVAVRPTESVQVR